MKDKEAREIMKEGFRCLGVEVFFEYGYVGHSDDLVKEKTKEMINELGEVSIKDCPKCKHPVMASNCEVMVDDGSYHYDRHYQCLTCGSEFTCSSECVCKLVGK